MKGLVIRAPWIDYVLNGRKTWEIRGSNTNIRGKIALIKSGSGMIYGTVELVDSIRLDLQKYQAGEYYHCIPRANCDVLPYKNTYAWIMKNPVLYDDPIPYVHPLGAVIWVKLDDSKMKLKTCY